jgi:hypothetical protein
MGKLFSKEISLCKDTSHQYDWIILGISAVSVTWSFREFSRTEPILEEVGP